MKNIEEVVSQLVFDIMDLAHKDTEIPRFETLHKGSANRGDLTDEDRTEKARQRRRKLVVALGVTRGIMLLLLLFAVIVSIFTAPKIVYSAYDCTSLTEGNCTGALAAIWQVISGSSAIAAVYTVVVILGMRAFLHHRLKQTHAWFVDRSLKTRIISIADVTWVVVLVPATLVCVYAWAEPQDLVPFLKSTLVIPLHAIMTAFFFR